MSDGGDYRYVAGRDYPCQSFVIECRKIFDGTATTRDKDDVHVPRSIEELHASTDFGSGGVALHLRGIDQDVKADMSTAKDIENVLNGCPAWRCNDAYGL